MSEQPNMEQITAALEAAGMSEEVVGQIAGATLFGIVRALVDAGLPVTKALRLAAFLLIEGAGGRGASRSMGLNERNARAYRAEIRQAMLDIELSDEIPPQYLAEWASAVEDRMLWAAKERAE